MSTEARTSDQKLATHIAMEIFECPLFRGSDRVQRIVLKGGKYPNAETDLGGLNEDALRGVIERALERYTP
jgi:hypothetical protein